MALRPSTSLKPRWFEPPTQNIGPFIPYVRCRGAPLSDEALLQELDRLSGNVAQRMAQCYITTVAADVDEDSRETEAIYGLFYIVAPRTLLMARPPELHQVLEDFGGHRSRSNREAGLPQSTAGRHLSGTVARHAAVARAGPIDSAPLLPPGVLLPEAEAIPEGAPDHTSGLPAKTLRVRLRQAPSGLVTVVIE